MSQEQIRLPNDEFPKNSSVSELTPGLQLGIDSTSLGTFKTCPRKYQLSIIEGWQPREASVHLAFGIWLHQSREHYEHERIQGGSHERAVRLCVQKALRDTWDSKRSRAWQSDHPDKNRMTLIRTIVWYLDEMAQNDSLETICLSNGKPAVELSFRFDSGVRSNSGEPILLCGHLDRLAQLGDQRYVVDIKTTGRNLGPWFWRQFTPSNQLTLYALASRVVFGEEVSGLVVDGVQVTASGGGFARQVIPRSGEALDEWLEGFAQTFQYMELCAERQFWPLNEMSCENYGGCEFREVCSARKGTRQRLLEAGFTKRVWDPLVPR